MDVFREVVFCVQNVLNEHDVKDITPLFSIEKKGFKFKIEIGMMIEDVFHIEIPDNEELSWKTVQDIVDYVNDHIKP